MMRHTSGTTIAAAAAWPRSLLAARRSRGRTCKVAIVDMQRALNECEAGKKAKDQVKVKFEKSQDQLKRQRDDLDRTQGGLRQARRSC